MSGEPVAGELVSDRAVQHGALGRVGVGGLGQEPVEAEHLRGLVDQPQRLRAGGVVRRRLEGAELLRPRRAEHRVHDAGHVPQPAAEGLRAPHVEVEVAGVLAAQGGELVDVRCIGVERRGRHYDEAVGTEPPGRQAVSGRARFPGVVLDRVGELGRSELLVALDLVKRVSAVGAQLDDVQPVLRLPAAAVELDAAVVVPIDQLGDEALEHRRLEVAQGQPGGVGHRRREAGRRQAPDQLRVPHGAAAAVGRVGGVARVGGVVSHRRIVLPPRPPGAGGALRRLSRRSLGAGQLAAAGG